MSTIPESAALALINAAIEDYRLITPPDESTPAGLAQAIAMYLASSGLTICPDPDTTPTGA